MKDLLPLFHAGQSYIYSQFHQSLISAQPQPKLFITISRQTGAGGITVSEKLGQYLTEHDQRLEDSKPWEVFEKNLVELVIAEHRLDPYIAKYMPEDKISEIDDMLDMLFGLHPSEWSLVKKTAETILRLAGIGNVILVGRAANVITRSLGCGLHVRLIGSIEKRVHHLQEYYQLSAKIAREMAEQDDRSRANYLKKYFNCDIDDPLLYDLIINTDSVSYHETARILWDAVLSSRKSYSQPV